MAAGGVGCLVDGVLLVLFEHDALGVLVGEVGFARLGDLLLVLGGGRGVGLRGDEVLQLGVVADEAGACCAVLIHRLGVHAGQLGDLLRRGFPHALADRLHHHGRDLFERGRVLLAEELVDLEVVLVLHVDVEDLVPQLVVDGGRLHHVPGVGVADGLGKDAGRRGFTLHLLFDIRRVEDRRACLYTDGLLDLLHADIATVAVVAEIGVGVLAGDVADGQVHTAHELVDVIEAEGAPRVALARLYDDVGAGQRGLEGVLAEQFPLLFAAVEGAHVMDIRLSDLGLLLPAVATLHHALDARAIVAIDTAEDAIGGHLLRLTRRETLGQQCALCFGDTLGDLVVELVIFRRSCHLHGAIDEEESRGSQVAQLAGGLHHHIDARATQLGRGDQA